jgi:hypothetical protein
VTLPHPNNPPSSDVGIIRKPSSDPRADLEVGTYWSTVRADGSLYGEGQGILMGKGGELATWVGQGVGTIKKEGGVSYRGAVYYQTSTPAWTRLNSVASIFEYELDTQGNSRLQLWEWK